MPKQTRLGADFQAELPLLTSPSVRPPPAPPPLCLCARPATWLRKRWWCADEERGCAFEVVPPDLREMRGRRGHHALFLAVLALGAAYRFRGLALE